MIGTVLNKHWYFFSVLGILLIAVFIRFYQLADVPHGMTWDEAAIGYNGYAVVHTRRDEWLNFLPVSFMSFGDYKAPLAIYMNGISTYLFGMNLFAVRLPFAVFSLLAILGIIILTEEIFETHRYKKLFALLAGVLITTSPWHIHFSRAGFESGIALAFIIWGLLFCIKALKADFKKPHLLFGAAVLFDAAIYTYHSAKIALPVLGFIFIVLFSRQIITNLKRIVLPLTIFVVGLIPFILDSVFGKGLTRAGVTIFSSDLGLIQKLAYVIKSYAVHLSPEFLLRGETTTLRHGAGYLGVLFITTFFLVTAGVISILRQSKKSSSFKYQLLSLGIIFAGLLPASVAMEVPHANRALLALPGFIFLAVFGLDYIINILEKSKLNIQVSGTHKEKNIVVKSFVGSMIAIHVLFSVSFVWHYFTNFAQASTNDFNDGYLEAFRLAQKYETGEGTEPVEKIIFTSDYGQPYIYALFVRKTNPIWYQGGSLIKYEFTDKINMGDFLRKNTLIVGSGMDDLPIEQADHIIYGADGSVRFQFFRTKQSVE
ncbi:MAG: hypothetical protein BroJett025_05220 [Patescibacteria group bacterium]|nr:MAG: hypothetical protein BroJett025_05220 [Patescibacteria group bacterium]